MKGLLFQDLTENNSPIAWKTGTSKSFKDAWAIGLVGNFVVGVWFGDNDKGINPALVGRSMAGPLFFQIADYLRNTKPYVSSVENPSWDSRLGLNIKDVTICSVSKKIITEQCTHHKETALFIPSVSPIEGCQIHRKIYENLNTHSVSCQRTNFSDKEKIIEVWPDDLLALYRLNGLHKTAISKEKFKCEYLSQMSQKLAITSPQETIDYYLYPKKNGKTNRIEYESQIQLLAQSESDSMYLDWFIDKVYVGRSYKKEPLFYKMSAPGHFEVRVSDNLGRSESGFFNVKISAETYR